MSKKELLSELIEKERAKLNRLIELGSEEAYGQSRYVDRLIELYMEGCVQSCDSDTIGGMI